MCKVYFLVYKAINTKSSVIRYVVPHDKTDLISDRLFWKRLNFKQWGKKANQKEGKLCENPH